MTLVDEVNAQWGRGPVRFRVQGTQRTWSMRQSRRLQRCTTCWNELLTIGGET
ncbi:DUF4113 domain-containing protein [Ktedonobacter sp. SOSP1-52]|uniref:DUF4113 domain-containing protein n=1 Tax=Ktedonobacter sp. SOSP1-52 TaxID=2778366 RepID=UPI0019160F76|nr:DUF4113 domain-containing protein [Ktedonobacter sp. SOSP1-52]